MTGHNNRSSKESTDNIGDLQSKIRVITRHALTVKASKVIVEKKLRERHQHERLASKDSNKKQQVNNLFCTLTHRIGGDGWTESNKLLNNLIVLVKSDQQTATVTATTLARTNEPKQSKRNKHWMGTKNAMTDQITYVCVISQRDLSNPQ